MTYSFIFPGQGAQVIGMGKALAEQYPASKAVFDEVDDALKSHLSTLIWEGESDDLTLTHNAQPALMATSLAAFAALQSEGVKIEMAAYGAGHSLGEYSALCAAGALSIAQTARLLRLRGEAMQRAVPVGQGAMAAILGLNIEAVIDIAEEASEGDICQAANDNDPSQIVISGTKEAVERACALAKEKGAKRALPLPVSAPFHCGLMQPAQEEMADALSQTEISAPKIPIIQNVTAQPVDDAEMIRKNLIAQVTGSVRWRESVLYMGEAGVKTAVEIGAGKALSGMVKRIRKDINTINVSDPAGVETLVKMMEI